MPTITQRKLSLIVGGLLLGSLATLPGVTATADRLLGTFELDGNAALNGAHDDWASFYPTNTSSTVFNWTFVHEGAPDTTYFTIGSKDIEDVNEWFIGGNSAPDKDEILDGFAASYNSSTAGMLLYFGADRYANNGDAAIGFWFLQGEIGVGANNQFTGNHVLGDTFVVSHFTNGGTIATIYVYEWDPSVTNNLKLLYTGADCRNVAADAKACARVNGANAASPWPFQSKGNNAPANTFLANELFEGGVNLTAIYGNNLPCFNNFLVETRSSQETTATLKDLLFGGFHNCPEVPPQATPSIEKFAIASPVDIGSDIGFRLEILQGGPDAALWMNVTDTLPAVSGSWSVDDTANCTIVGDALTCSYTNVPPLTLLYVNVTAGTSVSSLATDCGPHDNFAHVIANEGLPTEAQDQSGVATVYVTCADVGVVKTAAADAINLGDQVNFSIVVTSYGPDPAENVTLADTLPNVAGGFTLGGDNATACSLVLAALSCDFGTLPNGTTRSITLTATPGADDCRLISNTAFVTARIDTDSTNNESTDSTQVRCSDVSVDKTAAAASVYLGSNVTFTITVSSHGPDAAENVTLTDTLPTAPAAWEIVSSDPTCAIDAGTLSCAFGTLPNGSSASVTVTSATSNATTDCGVVSNTATAGADVDLNASNNEDTATETVLCSSVSVEKTAAAPSVDVGGNVTFTITAHSNGPDAAIGVTVNDTLPTSPSAWEIASSDPTCGIAAGALTCDFGDVPSGESRNVTVTSATTTADCGDVTNYAGVTAGVDTTGGDDLAWATEHVACADVGVTKTAGADAIDVGDNASFSIAVTSYGPDDATNVHLNDTLPGVAIAWEFDGAAPSECSIASGALTCDWATLAAGATAFVNITGATTTADCGAILNFATVGADLDTNASNNEAWDSTYVTCADPGVQKTADAESVDAGGNLSFTITVTSYGPDPAENVHLADVLPAIGGAWSLASGAPAECAIANGTLTCDWTTLAPGSVTIGLLGATTIEDCGDVPNTATVSGRLDTNTSNNEDSATEHVNCADVSLAKTAAADSVDVGGNVSFTITVTSWGPDAATGVGFADALPSIGTSWDFAAPDGGSCAVDNGTLTCSFGTLQPGEQRNVTLTAATTLADCGDVRNEATAFADLDINPENDRSGDVEHVLCADVSLTKTAADDTIDVGGNATFTLTLTSNGPDAAEDAGFADALPAIGTSWTVGTPDGGSCAVDNGTLTCGFGTLQPGESRNVTLTGTTTLADCGPIWNFANATARVDSNSSNDAASASVYVTCADVSLAKTAWDDRIDVGGNATFTLTVTSEGPDDADNVTIDDVLPSIGTAWEIASSDATCAITSGALTCDFGTVPAGQTRNVTVTAQTTTADCSGVSNTASVAAALDTNSSNNEATAEVLVTCADVSVEKTAGSANVTAGQNATWTVTIRSLGPDDAANVTVSDVVSNGTVLALSGNASAYCGWVNATVTCDIPSLAAGAYLTLGVTTSTSAADCGTVTNSVRVGARVNTDTGNDDANATVEVVCPRNATRTQGFWATHTAYTERVFDEALGGSLVIGDGSHTRTIDTYGKLFGAWYSDIAKKTTGQQRPATDKARMTLLQQLVTAELNCAAFGCNATVQGWIAGAHLAYAGNNKGAMATYTGLLDAYNNGGDGVPLPDTYGSWNPATPDLSKAIANTVFWNNP